MYKVHFDKFTTATPSSDTGSISLDNKRDKDTFDFSDGDSSYVSDDEFFV